MTDPADLDVTIVDGYVDEPAHFGVPPYISTYPRYTAGGLVDAGVPAERPELARDAFGRVAVQSRRDDAVLEIVAVDVRQLAVGSGIPAGIDGVIPMERHWKQRSSLAPIYEAV